MNSELKKMIGRLKATQAQVQSLLKDKTWVEDARNFAEKQGKEVKKLINSDIGKVKGFLERERKELERFQKQIPGEVKKFRRFVDERKKELEKMLANTKKMNTVAPKKSSPVSKKKATGPKKKTSKKSSSK